MARILNFWGYFIGAVCVVGFSGLISRVFPSILPWYWGFLALFLLILLGISSAIGRKAAVKVFNTSEPILLGVSILLFIGCILGGIMSHA